MRVAMRVSRADSNRNCDDNCGGNCNRVLFILKYSIDLHFDRVAISNDVVG